MLFVKPLFITFLFLSCLIPLPVGAQEKPLPSKVLNVGVALGEPFAISLNTGFHGIAIDIWKLIADEQNLQYQFVSTGEHIDDAIKKLATGEIDVLVGPIVPTYERTKLVDFMQPYYLNQIGLVVPLKEIDFFDAIRKIFTTTINSALIIFLICFVLYIHVFWYFERKTDPRVPAKYWVGMKRTFWLHTLDIDLAKLPTTAVTRAVRFFWLILLTLFFSSITAALTSALTIALSDQYVSYDNLDDFKNKKIAAVVSTAPFDIARERGFNLVPVDSREEAFKLLLSGKVAAYVDYYPIADYYLTQHLLTDKLTMANVIIKKDTFAFALSINNPLRHVLNLKLRSHQDYGLIKAICEKYFGDNQNAKSNCEI